MDFQMIINLFDDTLEQYFKSNEELVRGKLRITCKL